MRHAWNVSLELFSQRQRQGSGCVIGRARELSGGLAPRGWSVFTVPISYDSQMTNTQVSPGPTGEGRPSVTNPFRASLTVVIRDEEGGLMVTSGPRPPPWRYAGGLRSRWAAGTAHLPAPGVCDRPGTCLPASSRARWAAC